MAERCQALDDVGDVRSEAKGDLSRTSRRREAKGKKDNERKEVTHSVRGFSSLSGEAALGPTVRLTGEGDKCNILG